MKKLLLLVLMLTLVSITYAADTVIEGFEPGGPVLGWQSVSSTPQTHNASLVAPNVASTAHVTEGTQSGTFSTSWTKPSGGDASTNYYYPGGTLTFWGVRINCSSPLNGTNIPNNSKIRADIFNNTGDPIQVAIVVQDNGGTGGMERGPFLTLAANATNTYEWKMGIDPTVSWITGTGALDGSASKLKGILIYSDVEPGTAAFSMDVDNIRIVEAQADLVAPDKPVLLSTTQGSAAGKLLIKWVANTEPDLSKYSIYMATNQTFGKVIGNRFDIFTKLPGDIAAPATQTEIDVPTTGPVYIYITAWDNALPQNNESVASNVLGASLNPSGSAVADLYVLDLKRYLSGSDYTLQGYYHMIAYGGMAMFDNNRYFGACTAKAVADGAIALTPNAATLVMWSCARDGETTTERSVQAEALPFIASYVTAGGKLIISGTGLGKDMVTAGNATAFFTDTLKANLVSGTANQSELMGDGALSGIATFFTGTNIWDYAAFAAATNNEVLSAQVGGEAAISYAGGAGNAAVVYGQQVATLGFGFESVRHAAGTSGTFAMARATRALLLDSILDYFFAVPPTAARVWNIYE